MSKRLPCSRCGMARDMEIVEREEQVTIKGKEVSFLASYTRCLTCGNEFETSGQLDDSLDAAREAYARLYESPSPEALVSLRTRYNASQKAFGAILGFGELTMNGYESGGTPDSTNRLLLKLSADPLIFKAMYDINSSKIGAIQRRRIEESDGFKAATAWVGLQALSGLLTPQQQDKIDDCAEKNGRTVPQQIATYVESASSCDYSRMSAFVEDEGLFLNPGKNDISTPLKTRPPMTVAESASSTEETKPDTDKEKPDHAHAEARSTRIII